MSITFNDRVAIVTGAGGGLGWCHALDLASRGATVIVNDLGGNVDGSDDGSSSAAEMVVEEIKAAGGKAMANGASVTDSDQVKAMVEEVMDKYGRIDILVNNAGITQDNLFMRMKPEQWSQVIDVNLNGVFHVTKAVIRTMVKQHSGRIINISSVVGFSGNPGQVNYSSTKSGLIGFTKSLSREVGTRGITVNAVAPGFINTAMTQALNESQQQAILNQIPLGRMGEAEDIANAVAFLASEEASYITGTVLHVNGGMY